MVVEIYLNDKAEAELLKYSGAANMRAWTHESFLLPHILTTSSN